jgi:hypothetical protein
LVSQPALPVVPISLRLARERGETNNNVERVSLERSTGVQTGKLGVFRRGKIKIFKLTAAFSQSAINPANRI